jgi:sugar O-acyltransferase (sialic acid O-acetyltransferase NeuD family)
VPRDLVIIGCGGFGREAADVVDAINRVSPTWQFAGFVDDHPSAENVARVERRGSTVIGGLADVSNLRGPAMHFVVGVGSPAVRARLATAAETEGWTAATLIHPFAVVGANVILGSGTVICAHSAIGSDVTVGRHVHLDRAAQVGHDSVLGDFVTAHPAAVVSGNCHLKDAVELGTNSTLLPSVSIGSAAVVGAGACVTKDVAPGAVVRGVPAR